MALRGQTILGKLTWLAFATATLHAQPFTFEVRHRHWHGGAPGTLRISATELAFEEHGKKKANKLHEQTWTFERIQQLTLGSSEVRVLTYDDAKWQIDRDREFIFDRLPEGLSMSVYPLLAKTLDQRFIAAIASLDGKSEWRIPAKLNLGLGGAVGSLQLQKDSLVFETKRPNDARTWKIAEIESVSSNGPFDLTITTLEKSGFLRGGGRQFHFQLQQALSPDRYNEIWRAVNRANGLSFLEGQGWER